MTDYEYGYVDGKARGVSIGKFTIRKFHITDGVQTYWIEKNETGEGMQTSKSLEELIEKFFKEEF